MVVLLSACIINIKYVIRLARDTDVGVLIFFPLFSKSYSPASWGTQLSRRVFKKSKLKDFSGQIIQALQFSDAATELK